MLNIAISQISPSGWNKRGEEAYQDDAFQELKKSIQEHGFWQHKPLLVREYKEGVGYQLLGGHRRLKAAQELGLESVPTIIEVCGDIQAKRMVFLDNFHHRDLEPLEEAEAIQDLLADGMTQEDLAKDVGKSQSWIANRLRLLKAPEGLKELIISRQISPKHVMALLPFAEHAIFKEVILPELKKNIQKEGQVSVSELEDDIDRQIRYNSEKQVLPLHDFPYDAEQYREFFDFSSCYGVAGTQKVASSCKDIYAPAPDDDDPEDEEQEEPERFCLNRRCWSDKLNIAKRKSEKARADKVKTMGGDDTVDLKTLKYDEFERVGSSARWDKTECQECKSNKQPLEPERDTIFICLDRICLNGKVAALHKQEQQMAKSEATQTLVDMDLWIEKRADISYRGIIKLLCSHLWGDSIKQALKPWTSKGGKWNLDEVDKIPDEDLLKAFLRLCIVQDLTAHNYSGVNRNALKRTLAIIDGRPLPKEE